MLFENILLALESLRVNKLRSFLTMLGIIIGIGSVISIMTVGDAMTSSVEDAMSGLGGNTITVSLVQKKENKDISGKGAVFGQEPRAASVREEDQFTLDMIRSLCEKYPDQIRTISASESVGSGSGSVEGNSANISLTGVSAGYFIANKLDVVNGSYLSAAELEDGGNSAMVSDRFAKKLYGSGENALGKTVDLSVGSQNVPVSIVGVYHYKTDTMAASMMDSEDTATEVYIPLKLAKSYTHTEKYSTFSIVTRNGVDSEAFAATAERFLSSYYRTNPNFEPSCFSMASIIDQMSSVMSTVTLAITAIAAIALVVGGIGVMNIMLVSITERTREIGTRKALGATNGSIRMQFIVEAIIICLVGGGIGILLGMVLGVSMTSYLHYTTFPSLFSILLSLGFSMAVGVFFGYYPANKAAKMNPIEALRYE